MAIALPLALAACSDACGIDTAQRIDVAGPQARDDWKRVAQAWHGKLTFSATLAEIGGHPRALAAFERAGVVTRRGKALAFAPNVAVSGAANDDGSFDVAEAQAESFRSGAEERACDFSRPPVREYRVNLRLSHLTALGTALLAEGELYAGTSTADARPFDPAARLEAEMQIRADIKAGDPGSDLVSQLTILGPQWSRDLAQNPPAAVSDEP